MARWQLTEPHYLNVPGTQTEDRSMGDNSRKKLSAPLHLDPNDEKQWNYREMIAPQIMDGKIVVCYEGKGEPKDIIFVGDPTPGMLPMDDEAREISSKFTWLPTETLNEADSFSHRLLLGLLTDTATAREQAKAASMPEGMAELMKGLTDMMKMQTQLFAALTGKTIAIIDPEPAPEPDLGPEHRKFDTKAAPDNIRDARRLSALAREPAE